MIRVAVTSRSFSRHAVLRQELDARFPGARFNETGESLAGETLRSFLRGHERAIVALEPITAALLEAVPELRVISKYGVGLDTLDLDAMTRSGVALGWTAGVNRLSVAELTLAFAILALHRAPEAMSAVRDGRWRQIYGHQLTAKTVGIVGCGHVGKEVVRLLAPFGCRVLAFDRLHYPAFYLEHRVEPVSLDRLLAESDVVTLHLPLDDSTRGILDAARVASIKRGAILINAARGGLLDEAAVKAALDAGQLTGAAFDVLAGEPPTDRDLIDHPKVRVTPHIGGSTEEAVLAMGRAAIDGLERFGTPADVLAAAAGPDAVAAR
jgi:D-3-phosphoglycerate dehydrogenase